MKSVRRPAVALGTMLVLVLIQAIADPTGLLALVGWSGALPQLDVGIWQFAPYVVYLPVLLGVVWWVDVARGRPLLDARRRRRARRHARAGRGMLGDDLGPRHRRLGGRVRDGEGCACGAHRGAAHAPVRREVGARPARARGDLDSGRAVRGGGAARRRPVVDRRGVRTRCSGCAAGSRHPVRHRRDAAHRRRDRALPALDAPSRARRARRMAGGARRGRHRGHRPGDRGRRGRRDPERHLAAHGRLHRRRRRSRPSAPASDGSSG